MFIAVRMNITDDQGSWACLKNNGKNSLYSELACTRNGGDNVPEKGSMCGDCS
jgi:hypothetical protein